MLIRRLPYALIAIVAVAAAGAWLGGLHWLGDLLALVVDYYLIVALLLLIVFARRRAWPWVAVAALAAGLSGAQLVSYPRQAPDPEPAAEGELRLLVYNLYHLNQELDALVALIEQYDPDVVFLMEYSDAVQATVEESFADYPYRLITPSRLTMGLALFSKLPLEAAEVHRAEATRIPVYDVSLLVEGRRVSFVGGHPWPPQPRWGALHRAQMEAIIAVAAEAEGPLIVAGDFNAAPWSHTLRRLGAEGEVVAIRQGFDLTKTWRPFPGFGLPVDFVLVSPEWRVLAKEYGPRGGSDHVPLIVDLALAGS